MVNFLGCALMLRKLRISFNISDNARREKYRSPSILKKKKRSVFPLKSVLANLRKKFHPLKLPIQVGSHLARLNPLQIQSTKILIATGRRVGRTFFPATSLVVCEHGCRDGIKSETDALDLSAPDAAVPAIYPPTDEIYGENSLYATCFVFEDVLLRSGSFNSRRLQLPYSLNIMEWNPT